MKNIQSETSKIFIESARALAQVVASSSFEFWKRKDFQLYVDFGNLPQTEQDRMFNELEVSVLGLFFLHFDYAVLAADKEYKAALKFLQKEIIAAFLTLFRDLKIEEKFVKQWEELIDMRLKEYGEDFKIAFKESSQMAEFKGDEEDLRFAWARIETITIDCLTHIRRGKVEEKDPLWKLLRKWLITLNGQLNPIIKFAQKEDGN